jgi:hypothetical protein
MSCETPSKTGSMPDSQKTVAEVLKERGSNYGAFTTHASYAEALNVIYSSSPNWKTMEPDCKEALRIIANKIGRILNGNPEYDDNWRDIAGYATLVLNRITKVEPDTTTIKKPTFRHTTFRTIVRQPSYTPTKEEQFEALIIRTPFPTSNRTLIG